MGAPKLTEPSADVGRYFDPRDYLRDLFESLKGSEARFSYERFSEMLGFGRNSYAYQIIAGTRPITEKAALRFCNGIPLVGRDRRYFLAICRYQFAKALDEREAAIGEIIALRSELAESDMDRAQIEYFSEWYHPVVRELVALADFRFDPAWIVKRISPEISTEQAIYSLKLLQRVGYIELDPVSGRWVQTEVNVKTSVEVRSLALLRFHRQMIERAKEAILAVPSAERDVSAITIALSDRQFQELKKSLQATRREVLKKFASETRPDAAEPSRIYQLNTQLFPLTRRS